MNKGIKINTPNGLVTMWHSGRQKTGEAIKKAYNRVSIKEHKNETRQRDNSSIN